MSTAPQSPDLANPQKKGKIPTKINTKNSTNDARVKVLKTKSTVTVDGQIIMHKQKYTGLGTRLQLT